jgi:predicted double-glycine peptidase
MEVYDHSYEERGTSTYQVVENVQSRSVTVSKEKKKQKAGARQKTRPGR